MKTTNTPSFNITDYIKSRKPQYDKISFTDLTNIVNYIPVELDRRNEYLKIIADWFIADIITPIIKEHILRYFTNLSNKQIKNNSPNTFQTTINQQININNNRRR